MKANFIRVFSGALLISMLFVQTTAYADNAKTPDDLRNADIETLAAQPRFDSREYGIVTPVKDQGNTSLCWAYSTASASETSILRKGIDPTVTAKSVFLSPQQIGYARHNRGSDPLGNTKGEITAQAAEWAYAGSGTKYAAGLLSTWCGPVGKDFPHNVNGWENAAYKLESAVAINGSKLAESAEAREKMKRAIVKYGAVTFSYNNARETERYNPNNDKSGQPHACTIIGWDDTLPAETFVPGGAKLDGGWLVKNSYNSLQYFYISYEVTCEQIYAFDYAPDDKYDYNYFYDEKAEDFGIGSLIKITNAANIFKAKKGTAEKPEEIKAVSVGISGENAVCTVEIYTDVPKGNFNPENAAPAASKTVNLEYGGFNCIELDTPVKIENGSDFAVVAKVQNGYITLNEASGKSYANRGAWMPLDAVPRIKAFTKIKDKIENYVKFISDYQVKAAAGSGVRQLVLLRCESGILKDVHIETIDFDAANEKTIALPIEWKRTENTVYKAFLWDSLNNLKPLCDAAELA